MTDIVTVTNASGEGHRQLARPVVDGYALYDIAISDYGGRIDIKDAVLSLNGKRIVGVPDAEDVNVGRRCFRAIEKVGIENGTPFLPIFDGLKVFEKCRVLKNKLANLEGKADPTPDDLRYIIKLQRKIQKLEREYARIGAGKTGIRLANLDDPADQAELISISKQERKISGTWQERSDGHLDPVLAPAAAE